LIKKGLLSQEGIKKATRYKRVFEKSFERGIFPFSPQYLAQIALNVPIQLHSPPNIGAQNHKIPRFKAISKHPLRFYQKNSLI